MTTFALTDRSFSELTGIIYRLTGVSIDETKRTLIHSRLSRRVRRLGLDSADDYVRLLRQSRLDPDEMDSFIDAVTTHKTSFFRTASVWEAFAKELEGLSRSARPVSVWSCACSSGQEAFSAAALAELLLGSALPWSVQATDVSPLAVQRARKAQYELEEVERACTARPDVDFGRFFEAVGVPDACSDGAELVVATKQLRDRIHFHTHNLLHPATGMFDVVFLRNVIIYFSEEDRRKAIGNAIEALRPGGLLVLGESETMRGQDGPKANELQYEGPCLYRRAI